MSVNTIIICAAYVFLQHIRLGFFRTAPFSLHDPIYYCVTSRNSRLLVPIRKFLCNLCFIIICLAITYIASSVYLVPEREILWGIGLGGFCMSWPNIYIYRMFAFWKTPAAFVHLLLNIGQIVYSLCVSRFLLSMNVLYLVVLLLPIVGGHLRKWTDESRTDYLEDMSFETKLYVASKKIQIREKAFWHDYSTFIEDTCRKNDIPPGLFVKLIIVQKIELGQWYKTWYRRILTMFLPRLCLRRNTSLGVCQVKPSIAFRYCDVKDSGVIRKLADPEKNIQYAAMYIRDIIDQYYIKHGYDKTNSSYTYELCRYLVNIYNIGDEVDIMDYNDIYTEILFRSV